MSINVQFMQQMNIFLTGNLPCCRASAGSQKQNNALYTAAFDYTVLTWVFKVL